ncbi:MAG: hypothetical protein AB1938_02995 [Myxococcota bacterium]
MGLRAIGVASASCSLVIAAWAWAGPPGKTSSPGVETVAIAERVVGDVARVQTGEIVFISGNDLALVEELGLAVQRRGGLPLELFARTERARRYFDEVPAKFDRARGDLWLKLAELPQVTIEVGGGDAPEVWRGVPPDRLTTVNQSYARGNARLLKRNVRQVELGNGLFPSDANARRLGLTRQELENVFRAGVATDPEKLAAAGERVRELVTVGTELRVTAPNGTDLRMRVDGRKVLVSDGVISPEEAKQGGAAAMVWLPAGEAYVSPVPGTATGRVVWDRIDFRGNVVEGLTALFTNGKVTSLMARPSPTFDEWRATFDKSPPCRDSLAVVDIGLNADVKPRSGKPLLNWVPQGMVSVFFGGDLWAGGSNDCPFGGGGFLPDATVTIDGKPLVEKGVLVQPGS